MANEFAGIKVGGSGGDPGTIPVIFMTTTTPADAAFPFTPANGTMVFCTTDHKLYIREGGSWIKTAALT